ncbi:MAG: hypothetical protein Q4F07_03635 [Bacteroidales bacterium]|nr:hypothetical protein [Bacteroidales bacterium]
MKKILLTFVALSAISFAHQAYEVVPWVDWDKIQYWAGDPAGENRTALIIDFQKAGKNYCYVWGYRWNGTKTGEDLVRAVAAQSSVLTALVQYTGTMGSTLNGLGISDDREELDYLIYDYASASESTDVSFGYTSPTTAMGQDGCPGPEAEPMCYDAIEVAKETGIIEHPLNAIRYGYPAYDYDFWDLDAATLAENPSFLWYAHWYKGYWSYWHGPNDYEDVSYSALGMSSTLLVDGYVQVWKATPILPDETMSVGGDLNEELSYDIKGYNEQWKEYRAPVSLMDMDKIQYWGGKDKGEKTATVIVRVPNGDSTDDIVYGYRWTGGYDDRFTTVLENLAKADSHLTVTNNDGEISLTYTYGSGDAARSGVYAPAEAAGTTYKTYIRRVVDAEFVQVPSNRWLNPGAVLIVSASDNETPEFDSNRLNFTHRDPSSGVEDIAADTDGTAEYFTLTGVKVAAENLSTGIYLERRGNTVNKIYIR